MTKFTKIPLFIFLLCGKLLYIKLIDLRLSDSYEIFYNNKSVNLSLIPIELVFFLISSFIVIYRWNEENPLVFFEIIVFFLGFIPSNSTRTLCNYNLRYYVILNMYYIALFLTIFFVSQKFNNDNDLSSKSAQVYSTRPLNIDVFFILCCFLSIALVLYVGLSIGFGLSRLTESMYSVRSDYAYERNSISGSGLSYLLLLLFGLGKWFIPLFLYNALCCNRKTYIALALVAFLYLFIRDMQKTNALIPFVIIGFFLLRKIRLFHNISIVYFFICIYLLSFFTADILFQNDLFGLIINRQMYLPSFMTYAFYEYFSSHELFYLRSDAFLVSNVLRVLFPLKEGDAVGLISLYYFNGYIPSPNTGLFAEAYLQFGLLGLLLHPFILVFLTCQLIKTSQFFHNGSEYIVMFVWGMSVLNVQILKSNSIVGILLFAIIIRLLSFYYSQRKEFKCDISAEDNLSNSNNTAIDFINTSSDVLK